MKTVAEPPAFRREVGPHVLVSDIETIANDILDDAVKVVADEAAAIADGDRAGVLYLWV